MARASADTPVRYLTAGSTPVTGAPLTMACWVYLFSGSQQHNVCFIGDSEDDFHKYGLFARGDQGGNPIQFGAQAGGPIRLATTSTGFSVNTWHHICGVEAASNDRRVYIDGGSKGTDANNVTPSGLDKIRLFNRFDPTTGRQTVGRVAEAAIWDVALTDGEIAVLARGVPANMIRPLSLVAYWPLFGHADPEIDYTSGGRSLTMFGTLDRADGRRWRCGCRGGRRPCRWPRTGSRPQPGGCLWWARVPPVLSLSKDCRRAR